LVPQIGVDPEHSEFEVQATHLPLLGSVEPVAQVPVGDEQSLLEVQPPQVFVEVLHTGVAPLQFEFERHPTQAPEVVLHVGVDPEQSEFVAQPVVCGGTDGSSYSHFLFLFDQSACTVMPLTVLVIDEPAVASGPPSAQRSAISPWQLCEPELSYQPMLLSPTSTSVIASATSCETVPATVSSSEVPVAAQP
jgi:hypothetical protein